MGKRTELGANFLITVCNYHRYSQQLWKNCEGAENMWTPRCRGSKLCGIKEEAGHEAERKRRFLLPILHSLLTVTDIVSPIQQVQTCPAYLYSTHTGSPKLQVHCRRILREERIVRDTVPTRIIFAAANGGAPNSTTDHRSGHHCPSSTVLVERPDAGRVLKQTIVRDTVALPSAMLVERPPSSGTPLPFRQRYQWSARKRAVFWSRWGSVTTRPAAIFRVAPETIVRDTIAILAAPEIIVRDTIAIPSAVQMERPSAGRLLEQEGTNAAEDVSRRSMLLPLAIVPWIREYLLRSPEFRPLNHLASGGNERRSKATIFGAVVGGEDVSVSLSVVPTKGVAWVWPPPPDCELEDLDESRALRNVKERRGLRMSRGSTDASLQSGGEIVSGTAAMAATKRDKRNWQFDPNV
ncbi:hypothetical protein C8J57DRAFT_1512295 [Mycena rebaudengoi]|nr:hypothetical protein C8J57DRAFT_1512295 [Mycena rebaudengoi]